MDLSLEVPGNYHFIRAISEEGIRVGDSYFRRSILLSASVLIKDWPPQTHEQFQQNHIEEILKLEPEVVIVGTGAEQHFLPQKMVFSFYQRNVGVEVMKTEAACRTFNVLVNEGRQVVAALMPVRKP